MEHDFVSISVMPVDARLTSKGEVQYADAPQRSADPTPEQVCQICWVPLDQFSIKTECPGPKVPNDISGLIP